MIGRGSCVSNRGTRPPHNGRVVPDGMCASTGVAYRVQKIRIVIAEDHDAIRAGIRRLLSAQVDIEVLGEARNGSEAYDVVIDVRPEVVVMDLEMPVEDGARASRRILAELPLAIIVLVSASDAQNGQRVATEIGAVAFVSKHECAAVLVSTIRAQVADRRQAVEAIVEEAQVGPERGVSAASN